MLAFNQRSFNGENEIRSRARNESGHQQPFIRHESNHRIPKGREIRNKKSGSCLRAHHEIIKVASHIIVKKWRRGPKKRTRRSFSVNAAVRGITDKKQA
jgi:hypothetical protein